MTEDEAYKVHIQYTFNAFCKIVIRHAAIDKILKLRRRWEREVSLDYLMNERFVQLAEPELLEEYLFTACGQTALLDRRYILIAAGISHFAGFQHRCIFVANQAAQFGAFQHRCILIANKPSQLCGSILAVHSCRFSCDLNHSFFSPFSIKSQFLKFFPGQSRKRMIISLL